MFRTLRLTLIAGLTAGCGAGTGTAKITTWGEEYIEDEIPASSDGGFIDGWTLTYEKFLVTFHAVTIADSDGTVAATMEGSRLVDNVVKGKKELATFPELEARAYDSVGYQIKPATATSELVGATEADRAMMVTNGYSVFIRASATKTSTAGVMITKRLELGFETGTQYSSCLQAVESGQPIQGIVVTEGGTDVSELTTHGDHFFYDRLKASPDPAVETQLRFQEKADADANDDGDITQAELDAVAIDVRKYDPSGLDAPNLGAFVGQLVRTVGHFRGEGECSISNIP